MQIYAVGGAVRDSLLGLPVHDCDWVVVGASPQAMLDAGYTLVGKDFPVFLHPQTHEEYALARTERKSAPGYHGFNFYAAPDVTLEQDLARRDFTINAMAVAQSAFKHATHEAHFENNALSFAAPTLTNHLVDPYGGMADLRARVLRHVSLNFAEDPVRILRAARFMARFTDFHIALETLALMRHMVQVGEVDALVAERVWQELARGLMCEQPLRMLVVLHECGALARIAPELSALACAPNHAAWAQATQNNAPLTVRVALLLWGLSPEQIANFCARLRVPNECRDLAQMLTREHLHLRNFEKNNAEQVVKLIERCDAIRKPTRFNELLLASSLMDTHASPKISQALWLQALAKMNEVDAGVIARALIAQNRSAEIASAVHAARVSALQL